jgi:hypothetical protein
VRSDRDELFGTPGGDDAPYFRAPPCEGGEDAPVGTRESGNGSGDVLAPQREALVGILGRFDRCAQRGDDGVEPASGIEADDVADAAIVDAAESGERVVDRLQLCSDSGRRR